MPSRTSFFNAAVFKKTLQRWWPLGLGYAAALTFTLLSKVGSAYGSFNPYAYYDAGSRTAAILQEGISSWVPALFAAAMVMAVVSWLFRTRGCAFVAALPVRRETVFVSNLLGALTLLAAAPVITAGALFLFTSTAEGFGPGILRWLVITELLTLAYFGLAALCAALT